MAAPTNERGPQKRRFFDWLINEINSGRYEGLYWLDENHTTFCIPWKHNSRKNLVENDYRIFQEWAVVSGKYNKDVPDPARWKTNFRCALNSTKRFQEVETNNPDCHVYRIITQSPNTTLPTNPAAAANVGSDHEDDPLLNSPQSKTSSALHQAQLEIDVILGSLTLENQVPAPKGNAAESHYHYNGDVFQWVMQQREDPWAPAPVVGLDDPLGEHVYQPNSAYTIPSDNQNSCLPLENGIVNEPVANNYYDDISGQLPANPPNATHPLQHIQPNSSPGINQANTVGVLFENNHFVENMFMNEEPQGNGMMNNRMRNDYPLLTNQQVTMEPNIVAPPIVPSPPEEPSPLQKNAGCPSLNLDVSIYYRGKLVHTAGVELNSCMFVYDQSYHVEGNPQIIQFPNPELLPDQKQIKHTLILLKHAGLLLYQKNLKIWARRLGRCQVFWALSKELDNMTRHSQSRILPRDIDSEIFDYEKFFQEMTAFRDGQKCSSPDYTIYLCFGQSFSAGKPKDLKLVLVKVSTEESSEDNSTVLSLGMKVLGKSTCAIRT